MNVFAIVSVLVALSGAYGAQLNAYLPPRGSSGSGAGFIGTPNYSGGGGAGGGSYGGGAGGGSFGGGAPSGPVIPIVSYENNPNQGDGSYSWSYATGNGIQAQESGRGGPGPDQGTEAQGSYSYQGPDGQTYSITYTAGANGFVAQGAHLPTPPPIPEAILKSIAFNAANPQSEYDTGAGSGSYQGGGGSGSYQGAGSGSYSGGARPTFPARQQPFSPQTGYQYRK